MTEITDAMLKEWEGLIDRMRKQSVCVYLATEKGPADDLSEGLRSGADAIEKLSAEIRRLRHGE